MIKKILLLAALVILAGITAVGAAPALHDGTQGTGWFTVAWFNEDGRTISFRSDGTFDEWGAGGFDINGTYVTDRNNMISITSIRVHRWSFDEILAPLSLGQGGPLTRDEVIPTIMAAMNQMMGQLSSAEVQRLTRVISEIDLDEIFATRVGTFIVRGETLTLTLDGETSVKQRTYLQ